MPLVLIGIGIAWLMLASGRTSRAAIACATASVTRAANNIGTATSASLSRTSEWGHQTVARLADRASNAASVVSDPAAEVVGGAHETTDNPAERTRSATVVAGAAFETAKPRLTRIPEGESDPARSMSGDGLSPAMRPDDARAAEAAHEHR
jgi:hypothetical protein